MSTLHRERRSEVRLCGCAWAWPVLSHGVQLEAIIPPGIRLAALRRTRDLKPSASGWRSRATFTASGNLGGLWGIVFATTSLEASILYRSSRWMLCARHTAFYTRLRKKIYELRVDF
ncbi:hypothetical protein BD410DRAFT_803434 [Rickenella mellea]|uniref:Uncharacterized protein n=1 Tax=Rickenella mellea TaxID=50990 RepID=A0A4Y7Q4U1_9AGAM|nr:hypothetical protein BD410DRAFT_803434 [Rickenella mellea]